MIAKPIALEQAKENKEFMRQAVIPHNSSKKRGN